MRNLADAIENFIIRQLLEDSEDTVLVQRNELADKLSCAPSQISYVISTRFTPEKGILWSRAVAAAALCALCGLRRPIRKPNAGKLRRLFWNTGRTVAWLQPANMLFKIYA